MATRKSKKLKQLRNVWKNQHEFEIETLQKSMVIESVVDNIFEEVVMRYKEMPLAQKIMQLPSYKREEIVKSLDVQNQKKLLEIVDREEFFESLSDQTLNLLYESLPVSLCIERIPESCFERWLNNYTTGWNDVVQKIYEEARPYFVLDKLEKDKLVNFIDRLFENGSEKAKKKFLMTLNNGGQKSVRIFDAIAKKIEIGVVEEIIEKTDLKKQITLKMKKSRLEELDEYLQSHHSNS